MARYFGLGHVTDREGFSWRDVPHAAAVALVATALVLAVIFALATVSFGPPPTVQSLLAAIEGSR